MNLIRSYLEMLVQKAHPDGGWGYFPGQSAYLEPTCLALLALAAERERHAAAIERGCQALRRGRLADGTYRLAQGRPEAVWPTAQVLFVLTCLDSDAAERQQTVATLLGVRGRVPPDDPEIAQTIDIDHRLVGWPWGEGNFSWVEPTAWACLALRRAGQAGHPRVEEGLRVLLDRALDEGGLNYGSRRILGKLTEPQVGPTAVTLLALQGREHPRMDAALSYLQGQAREGDDLENLCWAKLALDLYRDRPGVNATLAGLDGQIERAHQARTGTSWLRPMLLREALTALALGTDRHNPFRLPSAAAPPGDRAPTEVAEAVPRAQRASLGERLKAGFRGWAIEAANRLRQPPPQSAVHIAQAADYGADLADVLRRQYEAFRGQVPLAGKRVVLKPNLVEFHRGRVINTHPQVVAAVIELCRREGAAEVIVAEGPGHCRNVEHLVTASGLGDVLREAKVPFIDLNHDEPVKQTNLGRLTGLEHLYFARTVAEADVLISLPKLKTHHWVGVTLSLKNMFGTLPGICYGWPKNELHWRGIERSIIDIAMTRTPDLAIVDGIIGMEGDGPLNGTPRPVGVLVMGTDPLAVDATCCRVMQLDPEKVPYLELGALKKLGLLKEASIRQMGEAIAAVAQPFETVAELAKLKMAR